MTVGFFSPLPPARTGVADYSAALLAELGRRHSIRVQADGDINLYHLGNNQLHAAIYQRALERPGVAVLHDAVLQHFALGYFPRDRYIEEFVYNYGEWNRELAGNLWLNRARSAGDNRYFQYAMVKRIAETSRAVIVHNPAAAAIVYAHSPQARVVEIPHLYAPPNLPHPAEIEDFRKRFKGRAAFGVFGHLRESKRIVPILRVFAKLPDCVLLLAGDMASPDLGRAIEPALSQPNVHRIGYMPPRTYWQAAGAVDACINLRYPSAGETSGVSVGLMGGAKTVIMTDSPENSSYPEGVCIKISSGVSEAAELEAILTWSASHRASLRQIGAAASCYIRDAHSLETVSELYGRALTLN